MSDEVKWRMLSPFCCDEGVDAAVAAVVSERAGDRVVDRCVGVVVNSNSNSATGIDVSRSLCGMNGLKRRHAHLARKACVVELEVGDRKAADEVTSSKVRHAGHRLAVGAVAEAVEHLRAARRRR